VPRPGGTAVRTSGVNLGASGRAFIAIGLAATASACDKAGPPIAPDRQPSLMIEELTATATASECCADGPLAYQLEVRLREAAGAAATLGNITVTTEDSDGTRVTATPSTPSIFGSPGVIVPPLGSTRGTYAGITAPRTAERIIVRIPFLDGRTQGGVAEATVPVRLDVTGMWTGALPIRLPTGNWSSARVSLTQAGDGVRASLTSTDGNVYTASGPVSGQGVTLAIEGLPGTSTCAGVTLRLATFEFDAAGMRRTSGRAFGRCFGTVAGAFELDRQR
jgi:hypothetical protein